jgi:hypothetical protein
MNCLFGFLKQVSFEGWPLFYREVPKKWGFGTLQVLLVSLVMV